MPIDRRRFLLTLSASLPVARFLITPAHAADGRTSGPFDRASAVIVGRDDLSPPVSSRIKSLLSARIDGFDGKVAGLAEAMDAIAGGRDAKLNALTPDQTELALAIAKPWYLGYVGTPSGMIMNDDDAEFVTFLDAEAYELVVVDLPRPSYPPKGRGWWAGVPKGVTPPAMPAQVTDWYWQPKAATGQLASPDPAWKAYALGDYDTLEEARAALASASSTEPQTSL